MNYEETVSYLFERLPMYQRIGKAAYRADLRTTLRLASAMGNPEEGLQCIHIAGTNGKGSTAHALAAVFQACGYKTGLMTSPHYKDYRERIRINGEKISEDYVVDWVDLNNRRFEALDSSFFELTVMMGFCYFKEEKTDIAIIETGMGGRLDSTNIVSPELSIITPIGMDHQQFLGDSLEKIALEKAGIIKAQTPVLIAEGNEGLMPVFEKVAESRGTKAHQVLDNGTIDSDLRGAYQQKNLNTVMSAIDLMRDRGWELAEDNVSRGLKKVTDTGFMGRWQKISEHPRVIADAAHNEAGIRAVLENLAAESYDRLHIVIGMVGDKDSETISALLPSQALYHVSAAKILRAKPKEELQRSLMDTGKEALLYKGLSEALEGAKEIAGEKDLILITGSIFTVAELLP